MSNFDRLHHICIVVHDIDKTQAYYESIGIGPWEAYPPLTEYEALEVPNRTAFMVMRYRVCNLPTVQLQLCQPSADPSPQRIHLDTKGEGVFHIGFEVADADCRRSRGEGKGAFAVDAGPAEEPDRLHLLRHRRQGRRGSADAGDESGRHLIPSIGTAPRFNAVSARASSWRDRPISA